MRRLKYVNAIRTLKEHVLLNETDGGKPTAIDLFSGAGGLTLGLKQAGFNVLASVEIEDIPHKTYQLNHPQVINYKRDIRTIGVAELRKKLKLQVGDLDLLAGCPPCQGFSTLRTRNKTLSIHDDRNDLLFEFLRLIEGLLPKAIMMENVPALSKDERMDKFLKRLSTLGYKVGRRSVRIEDAADYGVPQRRKRMILLASRFGQISSPEKSNQLTVRYCLEGASLAPVGEAGDPLHDHIPKRAMNVQAIIKSIPADGGSRHSLPKHLVLECHKKANSGFRDVYGRMWWDRPAPTMTSGCGNPSKGRYLHPEQDRAISLREAAIFQTFPVDYKFDLSGGRGAVALMIGNALPPEFIRRHAIKIKDKLNNLI